jgi:hypothetical protein
MLASHRSLFEQTKSGKDGGADPVKPGLAVAPSPTQSAAFVDSEDEVLLARENSGVIVSVGAE